MKLLHSKKKGASGSTSYRNTRVSPWGTKVGYESEAASYTRPCSTPRQSILANLASEKHQAGIRVIAWKQGGGRHIEAQHCGGAVRQGISHV